VSDVDADTPHPPRPTAAEAAPGPGSGVPRDSAIMTARQIGPLGLLAITAISGYRMGGVSIAVYAIGLFFVGFGVRVLMEVRRSVP
jgi:hypothetical protein